MLVGELVDEEMAELVVKELVVELVVVNELLNVVVLALLVDEPLVVAAVPST